RWGKWQCRPWRTVTFCNGTCDASTPTIHPTSNPVDTSYLLPSPPIYTTFPRLDIRPHIREIADHRSVSALPPPTMAARMQQSGRPGGSRFAQFKLVLLGTTASSPRSSYNDANILEQVNQQ